MEGMTVPAVDFKIRVRDEQLAMQDEPNPYKWSTLTAEQIFEDKKVLLFSLPGAFTPTCSTYQLPNFEKLYNEFKEKHDIDEIYCVSVNDAFVMGYLHPHQFRRMYQHAWQIRLGRILLPHDRK